MLHLLIAPVQVVRVEIVAHVGLDGMSLSKREEAETTAIDWIA